MGSENIHCRAKSLFNAMPATADMLLLIPTRLPEAIKDIIFVGSDDKFVDGEAHVQGEVPGEDAAKFACWDNKPDLVASLE